MGRVQLFLMLASSAACAACVRDEALRKPAPAAPPREVAAWSFEPRTPDDDGALALWPPTARTPERKKRHLATEGHAGRLSAVVEGGDPCFLWQLPEPGSFSALTLRLDAAESGELQLFWSDAECPTFRESCSVKLALEAGQRTVAFLLDSTRPVRELRLDLPEKRGARIVFEAIRLQPRAELDSTWTGRDGATALELTAGGLRVTAMEADPWLFVPVAGLDASWVTGIELVVRGPGGPPQVYWDGPCGEFAEDCSLRLLPADGGALTHRGDPRTSDKWRGRIGRLRLDPGPSAGDYVVERLSLVRRPSE